MPAASKLMGLKLGDMGLSKMRDGTFAAVTSVLAQVKAPVKVARDGLRGSCLFGLRFSIRRS